MTAASLVVHPDSKALCDGFKAVEANNYHKLKLLIDAGLSVNVRCRPDVKMGNIFVLTFKIIFRNHHDLTPLHLACSRGNPKMVQLLIK